jgi:hypothetical protein
MKTLLMLTLLSAAPTLMATEPPLTVPVASPVMVATNAPALPEDLAEQAALVQQIGEDAARGFDPEAHAHALRLQIEALAAMPTNAKAPPPTASPAPMAAQAKPAPVPSAPAPAPSSAGMPARETSVRNAIQRMRSVLDDLEVQLNPPRRDQ